MPKSAPSPLVAYLRVFQAAQACTVLADVAMGFVFVHAVGDVPWQWPALALLLVSGAILYCGGAVLGRLYGNRPASPGSKRKKTEAAASPDPISTVLATRLGFLFLFNGVMLGAAGGYMHGGEHGPPWRSGVVAALLAAVLVAYNVRLKATPLATFFRGLARLLMVLLGMSAAGLASGDAAFAGFHASCWLAAGGIALYEIGVAWFERTSVTSTAPKELLLPLIPMVLGVALLGSLPLLPHPGKPVAALPYIGYVFCGLLFLPLVRRIQGFVKHPEPVERLSLLQYLTATVIVLDAVVAVVTSGPLPGILIAALLLPNFLLARMASSKNLPFEMETA